MTKNSMSFHSFMKSPYSGVKHSSYFDVYDELLAKYKNKNITLVEIGVLNGGSLFMWRDFLGEQARIIGVDLNPKALKFKDFGFEIYIGDQGDEKFWAEFFTDVGKIDILLDDGGHNYIQQISSFNEALLHMKDQGMIIIEDVHTSYLPGFGPKKLSFIQYSFNLINKINVQFSKNQIRGLGESCISSIQFFPAIVAIHINYNYFSISPETIFNKGITINAEDYRNHNIDNPIKIFDKISSRLKIINFFPGLISIKKIIRVLVSYNTSSNRKLRKYFKKIDFR